MGKYLEKRQRKWFWLLLLAIMAYTVKNIFVGADVDEGYGIMIGYRLLQGDKLLLEMWEPHQTSAIFTALFMKPFVWITGGVDFLNIYLRIGYFAVQGFLTWAVYHTLSVCIPRVGRIMAALLAAFFYVTSPKCIYVPEYSNLQIWFTTALILCLLWYFGDASPRKGQKWLLIMGGFFLACDVLAYPGMALVFPVCIGIILWRGGRTAEGKKRWAVKECVLFTAPCVAGALLFVGYVLSYMPVSQIMQVVPYILGDGSHQVGWSARLATWGNDLETAVVFLIIGGMLAAIIAVVGHLFCKSHGYRTGFWKLVIFIFFVIQLVFQMGYWILGSDAVVNPQLIYLFMCLFGIYCYVKGDKKEKDGIFMIAVALFGYLAVLLLSNWGPNNLNPYLVMGVLGAFLCWDALPETAPLKLGKRWMQGLVYLFVLCNVFGYSYRMIGGDTMDSTILEVRGYHHEGMRAGILTNYMTAYTYNTNQETWQEMIPEGSVLFYVGNSYFSAMAGDCVIAAPNTISTPSYDESLLAYWKINPDRYPDVVAVEGMYGQLSVPADSFVMEWLETEFKAAEIIEYPYMTVYKK